LASYTAMAQLQSLTNIKTWAYQLQGMNITQIVNDTSFKLIVIDYSADGTDATKFTPQEIAQIKASGKKVISYLSIGEAEDYRYYWQSSWNTTPPVWLGPENINWPGNYKVKFWDPQWQSIINSYIDTIAGQGFDGIYMDIIDAYYYWMVENPVKPGADTLMMSFVENIRSHVNLLTGNQNFIMIPQNAEDIINSDNVSAGQKTAYLNAVNAVGVEDVFCYGSLDEDNPFNPDTYRLGQLQEWQTAGKQAFSIEYLTQSTLIGQYVNAAHSDNFVPYVCVRALDQLCEGIPSGIEAIQNENNISVFPNPSSGLVYVDQGIFDSKTRISLISSNGQLIKTYSLDELKSKDDQFIIDISAYSDGLYFVEITGEQQNIFKKIINLH